MAAKPEFQPRLERIEQLIARIEGVADPELQSTVRQLVEVVMELHGTSLERILDLLQAGGEPGQHWIEKLGRDDLVSSILVLHGLHPHSLEDRVKRAIHKVRPSLQKRGGAVELLGIEEGVPRLRLHANGHAASLKELVEGAVYQAAPDVASLFIEGPDECTGFVPVEMLRAAAGSPSSNGHANPAAPEGGL